MDTYEKKYKEALERCRKLYNEAKAYEYNQDLEDYETIFPELKESEDELTWLTKYIEEEAYSLSIDIRDDEDRIKLKKLQKALAWLEKQYQQEEPQVYKTEDGEVITYSESDGYKAVEQKFKVGDWVVFNNKHQSLYQVEKIEDGYYILRHTHGGTFRVCVVHDKDLRLWSIVDAKDGDVLYTPEGCGVEGIFLIEGWKQVDDTGRTLCSNIAYRVEDDEIIAGGLGAIWWEGVIDPFYPATKEQRDLLFQKMNEAGYEWDANKKELKLLITNGGDFFESENCEQNPAWSKDDENVLEDIKEAIINYWHGDTQDILLDWLKSLKQRIGG